MNQARKTRILLAPLDWGLGHTTRCIPLIAYLQQKGCEVVVAAEGASSQLLTAEFPHIRILPLEGYQIRYQKGSSLFGTLLLQLPQILRRIRKEHQWLKVLLAKDHFDLVISDNRPGLWTTQTRSIYITHQLLIQSGKGKALNSLLQKMHTFLMKRFDAVWVPDLEAVPNLAGELSHTKKSLIQVFYLGLLSRLQQQTTVEQVYDLMVLLSGPEPQRSILEEKIYTQLEQFKGKVLLVRGLPASASIHLKALPHVDQKDHLPAAALEQAIAASKLVICRSGYTTLMDLMKLQQKAVLIPTPGQPEQEYLATYMAAQSYFPFQKQDHFDLHKAFESSVHFSYKQPFTSNDFKQFQTVIDKELKLIESR